MSSRQTPGRQQAPVGLQSPARQVVPRPEKVPGMELQLARLAETHWSLPKQQAPFVGQLTAAQSVAPCVYKPDWASQSPAVTPAAHVPSLKQQVPESTS